MTQQGNKDVVESFSSIGERNLKRVPYSQQPGVGHNIPYPKRSPIMHEESRQGSFEGVFDTNESWSVQNPRSQGRIVPKIGDQYRKTSHVVPSGGGKVPRSRSQSRREISKRQQCESHSEWNKSHSSPGYTVSDWNHMIKLLVHIQQPLPRSEQQNYNWNR